MGENEGFVPGLPDAGAFIWKVQISFYLFLQFQERSSLAFASSSALDLTRFRVWDAAVY